MFPCYPNPYQPARRSFRWQPVAWCSLLLLLLAARLAAAPLPAPPLAVLTPAGLPQYSVKAAYLMTFTRYIEWPAGTFPNPSAPIVIGVLGRNPFGDLLAKTVEGGRSQGREVQVRRVANLDEAAGCHMIFIGRGQERDEALWLEALGRRPVVTVTDSPEGLGRGAVLSLYVEEKAAGARVVFGANLRAARLAGLQLSAAMLPSAQKLIRGEGDKRGGQ